ncbi:hypothetical protein BT96DRAFT_808383 [Gymnopus androsaceus JB14]|uniref:T6SS Phospholipase effector Tle1-like catalytic domain-containing protein n=1 Tax=Gymnopus androsaceus JB14 TaxID=1447944 RepID=A0A6A4IDQ5_9AGAR|nr:hypothetical protein BT96DRAFT_808383 [Gymnopus androsaceus JB14]
MTEPEPQAYAPAKRVKKRIIVCCDGTWADGVTTVNRLSYTNALRLARTLHHEDYRTDPPTPQIVFYQSGIGSANNFYAEYVEGELSAFLWVIATNEHYRDDWRHARNQVFLFGFSRGAYTARMIAMFIGAIGILDRRDMDSFAGIFIAYQHLTKPKDEQEKLALQAQLAPWNSPDSPGIRRAYAEDKTFSVKCVGVFDTVGTLGLPEELTLQKPKLQRLYSFPDKLLGPHIERAYQALALNEDRSDFTCAKFEQKEEGRRKGQILRQVCWFTGCHSDIGGGYKQHDLADLTLTWMVAHIGDILAVDMEYLGSLPEPIAPCMSQPPHDPTTGIFALEITSQRPLPTEDNSITHETIHPSVLHQTKLYPKLAQDIRDHPNLIGKLLPLEEEM